MRGNRRLLVLASVLALAISTLGSSVGAKGKPPPKHPAGQSCEESGRDFATWDEAAPDTFTATLTPYAPYLCIDLTKSPTTPSEMTTFKMTVTHNGAKGLNFNVRDSHPGDFCIGTQSVALDATNPTTFVLPAATVNACGTEYSDNGTFDVTVEPDPFAFSVVGEFFGKKDKGATIVVTVTIPTP